MSKCYAFLQGRGPPSHDQRRCRVQKCGVAKWTWYAIKHILQRNGISLSIAAFQRVVAAAGEPGLFRRHFEGADYARLKRSNKRWAGEGYFVEPVRAMIYRLSSH